MSCHIVISNCKVGFLQLFSSKGSPKLAPKKNNLITILRFSENNNNFYQIMLIGQITQSVNVFICADLLADLALGHS